MLIQRLVLEEPAMEGTSNADPVSLNNSCSRKSRTVICGACACFLNYSCGLKKEELRFVELVEETITERHLIGIEICDYL